MGLCRNTDRIIVIEDAMMEEQSVEISSVAPTGPAQESAFANDVQSLASDDSASVESVNNRGGRRSIVKVALAGLGLAALAIGLGIGIGSSTNKAKGGANNVASSNAASADSSWGSGYECISEVNPLGSGKVSLAACERRRARRGRRGCPGGEGPPIPRRRPSDATLPARTNQHF